MCACLHECGFLFVCVCIILHVPKYVCMSICTVLPRIMARAFISFQQFLPRLLKETDDYYRKKHVLFINCDASN